MVWRIGTLRKCGAKAWWISEELDHFGGGGQGSTGQFQRREFKGHSSIPRFYREGPEASEGVDSLNVPALWWLPLENPGPNPDLGALLLPHLEDLILCSYSLGFGGGSGEREGYCSQTGAVPFLLLKPIVTFSWASRPLNTCSFNSPLSLPRTLVCEIHLGSYSVFSPPSPSPSLIVCPQSEASSLFL